MPRAHNPLLAEKAKRLAYLKELQEKAAEQARKQEAEDALTRLNLEPNHRDTCKKRKHVCECPQVRFLRLPDEDLDVLYGGSAGGGKSFALFMYALRSCMRYAGLQTYWFRNTFPELDTSIIKLLVRYNYAADLGCRWMASKWELQFANGSVLRLAHAKNEAEAVALRSADINLLILDERSTINPKVIELIYPRVRSGVLGVPCLGIRSATNPGGIGHGAIKKGYIEPTKYGAEEIAQDQHHRRRIFIQAKLADNPHLMRDGAYQKSLMGLPEDLRRALLDGDWNVLAGQMFKELSRERHVLDPIELPTTWRRYAGVDWGWAKPWAVIWGAVDEDGRVWLYREIYKNMVRESEQARQILTAEGDEDVTARYADDAMWFSRGEAKAIAKVYEDNGCVLEPAGKGAGSRIQGWARIHDFLAEAPACSHHRALGWQTCPNLHMFSTCKDMWRELEELPHATKGNPEDADTDADDHLCDALRYLLTNIGNEPRWYFVEADSGAMSMLMEADTRTLPSKPNEMIGGYPVMPDSGDPWSNFR